MRNIRRVLGGGNWKGGRNFGKLEHVIKEESWDQIF
jgi:hypothetical protein